MSFSFESFLIIFLKSKTQRSHSPDSLMNSFSFLLLLFVEFFPLFFSSSSSSVGQHGVVVFCEWITLLNRFKQMALEVLRGAVRASDEQAPYRGQWIRHKQDPDKHDIFYLIKNQIFGINLVYGRILPNWNRFFIFLQHLAMPYPEVLVKIRWGSRTI